MSGDLCPGINSSSFELAIVGEVRPGVLPSVLTILESSGKPVIFLASDNKAAYTVRESHPGAMVLPQYEGWLDALMLIAAQGLRAAQAEQRALVAEQGAAVNEAYATLGSFMLEKRHFLNDALTSVLGNSELLMSSSGALSDEGRDQVETIRNMALRMHEILQRFSSVETELSYVERHAAQQLRLQERSAAAGH
jgi:signal transduction histidine kinase